MSKFTKSRGSRRLEKNAYTLIELLMGIFIVSLATVAYAAVRAKQGPVWAALAGALGLLFGIMMVGLFYRWSWRRDRRQLTELREKYRTIYQIKELPANGRSIVKPDKAEIQIGDYGWEARPGCRDGLIHLQGLTQQWQVVWHAGFRAEQIEKIAEKPASQYDYWKPYWAKTPPPPPCPFPVRERSTPTMGLPYRSGRYFKDYPSQYYASPLEPGSQKARAMRIARFTARNKAISRHSFIWTVLFIGLALGSSRLCFVMDHTKPALWIQVLTGCGIFIAFVIYFVVRIRMAKRFAKEFDANFRFVETK